MLLVRCNADISFLLTVVRHGAEEVSGSDPQRRPARTHFVGTGYRLGESATEANQAVAGAVKKKDPVSITCLSIGFHSRLIGNFVAEKCVPLNYFAVQWYTFELPSLGSYLKSVNVKGMKWFKQYFVLGIQDNNAQGIQNHEAVFRQRCYCSYQRDTYLIGSGFAT